MAHTPDEGVHGGKLTADELRDGRLVRRRHVCAGDPEGLEALQRRCQPVRCDVGRDVRPVEAAGGEGRVLQPRREGMRDRVPDQRDELAHLYP